jgi:hypothetical protein
VGLGSNFMGRGGLQMATARIRSRRVLLDGEDGGIIPEPEPTEEDRRRMDETWARIQEENRLAREAGERLPPITVNIWGTPEE